MFAPLEEGASRALKPARDLVNWVRRDLQRARRELDLKTEVQKLRAQVARLQSAQGENEQLRKLLGLDRKAASPATSWSPRA